MNAPQVPSLESLVRRYTDGETLTREELARLLNSPDLSQKERDGIRVYLRLTSK